VSARDSRVLCLEFEGSDYSEWSRWFDQLAATLGVREWSAHQDGWDPTIIDLFIDVDGPCGSTASQIIAAAAVAGDVGRARYVATLRRA
jgi:hypothetical protein